MKGDDDGPTAEEDDPVLDRRLFDSITNFMESRLAVDQLLVQKPELQEITSKTQELLQEQIEIEQEQEKEVNRDRSRVVLSLIKSFEESNNIQVKVLINVDSDTNSNDEQKPELQEQQVESPKILMEQV